MRRFGTLSRPLCPARHPPQSAFPTEVKAEEVRQKLLAMQKKLMPLAGAALGAASGTLSGYLTDVGINDKWMKETAAAVQPGTAALFVLVRKVTADKVLERLKGEGGTVLKTSLDHTREAALQAALAEVKAAVPASPRDLPGV
jgi:uncharacterized membrane protein